MIYLLVRQINLRQDVLFCQPDIIGVSCFDRDPKPNVMHHGNLMVDLIVPG